MLTTRDLTSDRRAGAERGDAPTRNRTVPRTPEEITEGALEGIALGASIVHNHNDEPMFTRDGVPAAEPYIAAWEPVLARHPDALLFPTMGAGGRGIPVQRRWAHVEELARRGLGGMTLVDPGSVNIGLTSSGDVPEAAAAGEFGLPPTAAALDAYLEMLEPSGLPWSVALLGGDVVECGLAERAILGVPSG